MRQRLLRFDFVLCPADSHRLGFVVYPGVGREWMGLTAFFRSLMCSGAGWITEAPGWVCSGLWGTCKVGFALPAGFPFGIFWVVRSIRQKAMDLLSLCRIRRRRKRINS